MYAISSYYSGAVQFNLYCLNVSTGAQVWRYLGTGTYAGSPIISNGQVYIGTFMNGIQSFNASNGVSMWNFTNSFSGGGFLNSFYSGSPVVVGNYIYFSGQSLTNAFVFCLSASTGAQIWNYTMPQGYAFDNIVISDGYVYAVRDVYTEHPFSHNGDVYALNASSGATIWNSATSGYPNPPIVASGNVYISSSQINPQDSSRYNGKVYAFNSSSGTQIWSFETSANVTSPTIAGGVVYFASGDGYFHALNSSSGIKIWSTAYDTSGADRYTSFSESLTMSADNALYASAGYTMYRLDASTGTVVWSYKTERPIYSSQTVSGNEVLFGTGEALGSVGYIPVWHKVCALDALTGKGLWTIDLEGSINSPPVVVGDTVYVSLSHVRTNAFDEGDGGVYALKQATVAPPTPIPIYSPSNTPPPNAIIVPDDYPSIQAAVGNASAGDTIFVRRGTYYASQFNNIFINKSLTLIGENPKNTVINGQFDKYESSYRGDPPHWITFTVEGSNFSISGFTITNCPMVMSVERDNCSIVGNVIANSSSGIRLISEHNVISENNITGISSTAITVSRSNNWISDNTISGSGLIGIQLASGGNVTVTANSISGNGLTALDTGYLFSRGGILLSYGGPYCVYGNNITDNQDFGIQFGTSCKDSQVHDNNITRNGVGISLTNFRSYDEYVFGQGNVVSKNNFVDNSQNVFVEHTYAYPSSDLPNGTDVVSWDNGTIGNYWSDYQAKYPDATEIGNSGIGNTPYVIDENNVDHYPILEPDKIPTITPSPSTPPSTSLSPSKTPPPDSTLTLIAAGAVVAVAVLAAAVLAYRKKATNSRY